LRLTDIMQMHIKPQARRCPRLTQEQITKIKELYDQGMNYQAIADEVGCSVHAAWYHCQLPATIRKYRKKARESHNEWARGRYQKLKARYTELYEEGMLE